jgi:hypothetical protein
VYDFLAVGMAGICGVAGRQPETPACYHEPVRRLRHLVAAMAILLMVVPPLFDTFDTWDKGPELPVIGHNTETNVVLATASLGICFAVISAGILVFNALAALLGASLEASAPAAPLVRARATDYLLLLYSPPWRLTSLRI